MNQPVASIRPADNDETKREALPASSPSRVAVDSHRLRAATALPTPLHRLERLSELLGGPEIWIKRDDCTGLAGGGNKARKLLRLMADAIDRDAEVVLTAGSPQSNHARQTAAAAAALGLRCELFLQRGVPGRAVEYERCGNALLDRILGADITFVDADTDVAGFMSARAQRLEAEGSRAYLIPAGGSNALGATGYVDCATELAAQFAAEQIRPTAVLHATGSGGTQAGLIFGLSAAGINADVYGVSVGAPQAEQAGKVERLLHEMAGPAGITPAEWPITVDDNYIGDGYGQPTPEGIAAVRTVAQLEGILLDPVYTGKAMAALIDRIRQSPDMLGDTVVFLHTGGAAALHGYPADFH